MNKSLLLNIVTLGLAVIGLILYLLSPEKGSMVDYAIVLLVVTTALALFFSFKNIISDPETLKKVLIGVGFLLVVFVLSYFLADGNAVYSASKKELTPEGMTSKLVGTGIIYSLVLLTIGMALFLFDMIKNIIK